MKTSKCRSCGADIVWAETTAGKLMPLDAIPAGKALVLTGGAGAAGGNVAVVSRDSYVSHFATCPQADEWRKESA